jgi:hypothetical protein
MVLVEILVNSTNDQNEPDLSLQCTNSHVARIFG